MKSSGAETWYWALLSSQQSLTDTFTIPNLYTTPQNATVRVSELYPQNVSTSVFNEHSIEISQQNLINTITVNDYVRIDSTFTFRFTSE
ncbi:MAG: hypothetical protein R3A12_13620 [Ignavibacteria bacterium]